MSIEGKILLFGFIAVLVIVLSGSSFLRISSDTKIYENFSIHDYNKNLHSLKDFSNKKGIVLMFIATQCPVSNAYNSRMDKLHSDFGADFSFVGINSNKQEDNTEIKQHAKENNLTFVILKDSNNVIADKFKASVTPEIYILSNELKQLYHGRIDDSRRVEKVEISNLRIALTEIKEGKEVSINETKAFGCSIKRVRK
jgi:peroxiredoxin